MYADDTTLYCTGKSVDDVSTSLNEALDELHSWCTTTMLTPHPVKCEAMLLHWFSGSPGSLVLWFSGPRGSLVLWFSGSRGFPGFSGSPGPSPSLPGLSSCKCHGGFGGFVLCSSLVAIDRITYFNCFAVDPDQPTKNFTQVVLENHNREGIAISVGPYSLTCRAILR